MGRMLVFIAASAFIAVLAGKFDSEEVGVGCRIMQIRRLLLLTRQFSKKKKAKVGDDEGECRCRRWRVAPASGRLPLFLGLWQTQPDSKRSLDLRGPPEELRMEVDPGPPLALPAPFLHQKRRFSKCTWECTCPHSVPEDPAPAPAVLFLLCAFLKKIPRWARVGGVRWVSVFRR